jgi:hypothetical protein
LVATNFAPGANYDDTDKNGMTISEFLHPGSHSTSVVNPVQAVSAIVNGQSRPAELGWPISRACYELENKWMS